MSSSKTAKYRRNAVLFSIASVLLFVWVFPLVWAVIVSLKSESEVLAYPPRIVFEPTLQNYADALFGGVSILSSLITSLIVSGTTTVLTIIVAVPAAYAFARLDLRGKKGLGFYTLATQMVPPVGLVIPYFLILNRVGWLDTYQGMVIVYMTFSLPFAIWLMVSYMEDLPREMEEAAYLDKASRFQALWYIILPQVRGGIAVTVIFVFLNAWNEFLFAVQLGGNTVQARDGGHVQLRLGRADPVGQAERRRADRHGPDDHSSGSPRKSRSSRASPSAPSRGAAGNESRDWHSASAGRQDGSGDLARDRIRPSAPFDALKGIDLDIEPVEFFTLLGPSGSGKTTTHAGHRRPGDARPRAA